MDSQRSACTLSNKVRESCRPLKYFVFAISTAQPLDGARLAENVLVRLARLQHKALSDGLKSAIDSKSAKIKIKSVVRKPGSICNNILPFKLSVTNVMGPKKQKEHHI